LAKDANLQKSSDSLANAIITLRERFAEQSGNRKELSASILKLESESFQVQSERSRTIQRINAIEQDWIVVNMNSSPAPKIPVEEPKAAVSTDSRKYADLTRNAYFSTLLPSTEYATLRKAQDYERVSVKLLTAFEEQHRLLERLREEYIAAENERSADSLMTIFLNRSSECNMLVDSLASTWSFVFDNKTYMYDLLFDKEGRHDMLQRAEAKLFTMRQNIDRERGAYLSDVLVDYAFQKRCIVDYEIDVASVLGLQSAKDSLLRVQEGLRELRYDYMPVEVKRRYFLDYCPVEFSTKYIYNSKNPLPECAVFENGEMYRIKLGEFSERQPLSKFRGLEPVAYLRSDDGKWIYYAGAYPSVEALEKHLQTVKRLGFRTADVSAWIDGT
jgi:hypothetical protein